MLEVEYLLWLHSQLLTKISLSLEKLFHTNTIFKKIM